MRTKVTLVLLFLNVALFFFIFHFERDWKTEQRSTEARRRVLGAEAADIRHLEVYDSGVLRYTLERHADVWSLTKPLQWPANPEAVSRIISELQLMDHETSFSTRDLAKNGQSLADYGLDHPKMTVKFTSGDPTATSVAAPSTTLDIGDTTKVGNLLYILSPNGETIHVVSRALVDALDLKLETLRSDVVLTIPVYEARSLSIQALAPSGVRVRVRNVDGKWRFETPLTARASKEETELTINALDNLNVLSFVTQNPPSPPPSAAPSFRVALEGNSRNETLMLGSEVPNSLPASAGEKEYYAQLLNRPAVFTVGLSADLQKTLSNAQESLRDRHILDDFDAHAVTSIVLSSPNEPDLTLQPLAGTNEEGAAWQIVRKSGSSQNLETIPADREAVQRLLSQLSLLTAEQFKSDAPTSADVESWGFNRPERRITVTTAGAGQAHRPAPPPTSTTLEIGLGSRADAYAYARVTAYPTVYAVQPSILDESPVSTLWWRDRLLAQLPASAQITALSLTKLSDKSAVYAHKLAPGETWASALASAPETTRKAVTDLLLQLRTLHARKFVRDGFADSAHAAGEDRPWVYKLDATISYPTGTGAEQVSSRTLWLLDRTGGSEQLAGSQEFSAIFELEQPLIDDLQLLTEAGNDPGPVTPASKP